MRILTCTGSAGSSRCQPCGLWKATMRARTLRAREEINPRAARVHKKNNQIARLRVLLPKHARNTGSWRCQARRLVLQPLYNNTHAVCARKGQGTRCAHAQNKQPHRTCQRAFTSAHKEGWQLPLPACGPRSTDGRPPPSRRRCPPLDFILC